MYNGCRLALDDRFGARYLHYYYCRYSYYYYYYYYYYCYFCCCCCCCNEQWDNLGKDQQVTSAGKRWIDSGTKQ